MKPKVGKLLVAAPKLNDPNFHRTVILLIKEEKDGAIGLVLNRPTEDTLQHVFEQIDSGLECSNTEPLYLGGPVYGPLSALHQLEEFSEQEVLPHLYWSSETDNLSKIIESGAPYRIYSNYTGWGEGQLDHELNLGGWQIVDGTQQHVFYESTKDVWEEARSQCGTTLMEALGIKHIPGDPSHN